MFIYAKTVLISGDELLDEVCGDLQERIKHIKAVLGEQPALNDENISFLTMNNKAPFWNEASQVYQVRILSVSGTKISKNVTKKDENKVQLSNNRAVNNCDCHII